MEGSYGRGVTSDEWKFSMFKISSLGRGEHFPFWLKSRTRNCARTFHDDAGITGEAPPKKEVVFDEELKDDEKPAAEKPAEPAKPDDKAKPPVKEENAAKKTPAAPKQ
jgi:hypothetical protein